MLSVTRALRQYQKTIVDYTSEFLRRQRAVVATPSVSRHFWRSRDDLQKTGANYSWCR